MLSKTHNLVKSMTYALGPLFHEEPDYKTIQQAIALVIARIAMATPSRGKEFQELSIIHVYSQKALEELLKIEKEETAKKKKLDASIDGFAAICGYVDPPFNANEDPEIGLVAINGGMEAQAAAEEAKQTEEDLRDYYQDRCTLEDLQARRERRAALRDIEIIKAEEAEQARLDTYKEEE